MKNRQTQIEPSKPETDFEMIHDSETGSRMGFRGDQIIAFTATGEHVLTLAQSVRFMADMDTAEAITGKGFSGNSENARRWFLMIESALIAAGK
jgi:hypothetical protein